MTVFLYPCQVTLNTVRSRSADTSAGGDHKYLPPASEGWGKYCFHRCVSVHKGTRVPQSQVLSLVSGPRTFPVPGSFPCFWSRSFPGGTPVPAGDTPERIGVSPAGTGVPLGCHWGTPWLGLGYLPPTQLGLGNLTPQERTAILSSLSEPQGSEKVHFNCYLKNLQMKPNVHRPRSWHNTATG